VGIIVIITMSKIVAKGFSNQVASYLLVGARDHCEVRQFF
jgi:hypothetical protein